jgi:hypothetical protein
MIFEKKADLTAGFFCELFKARHLTAIQKTKSVEPWIARNIADLLSLSARAMQTSEERTI